MVLSIVRLFAIYSLEDCVILRCSTKMWGRIISRIYGRLWTGNMQVRFTRKNVLEEVGQLHWTKKVNGVWMAGWPDGQYNVQLHWTWWWISTGCTINEYFSWFKLWTFLSVTVRVNPRCIPFSCFFVLYNFVYVSLSEPSQHALPDSYLGMERKLNQMEFYVNFFKKRNG